MTISATDISLPKVLTSLENIATIANHKKAAAHLEAAVLHHKQAAKHLEAGNLDKADQSTILAMEHQSHAADALYEII